MKFKKKKKIFLGVLAHFTTVENIYYFYSRGIIGVIVHGHVININMKAYHA